MNSKFLAGLAVVVALVAGLAVVSLAKNTKTTTGASTAEALTVMRRDLGPSDVVETSVMISDTSVDTKVKVVE